MFCIKIDDSDLCACIILGQVGVVRRTSFTTVEGGALTDGITRKVSNHVGFHRRVYCLILVLTENGTGKCWEVTARLPTQENQISAAGNAFEVPRLI